MVSNVVWFKTFDLSWTNFKTFVSTSYAATKPLAVPPDTTCDTDSPIVGVPVTDENFNENELEKYARRKDLLDNGQFSNNDLNNDGE